MWNHQTLATLSQKMLVPPKFQFKYKGIPHKASVLVPLCIVNQEASILFTVRSQTLRAHTGEVSFPGGKQDPEDQDEIACALRETWEEIGIPPPSVQVVGTHHSVPNMHLTTRVTPVIGFIGIIDPQKVNFNPQEVSSVFTVPVKDLLDPLKYEMNHFRGSTVSIPQWPVGEHRIWGLTGYILWNFLQLLQPDKSVL